jgi:hypothetical protein
MGPSSTPSLAISLSDERRTQSRERRRVSAERIKRLAPVVTAGVLATVYVLVSPPSLDLAAHLFRAELFRQEGLGLWDNWWYAGHHVPGYSVLFPPLAAALTPQVAGALAATGSAALFEPLARRQFGDDAWLGALWFGAGTATSLFAGRLTFAFGLLPAVGAALALQRGRPKTAAALGAVTALASPVAALFAALAGGADAIANAIEERRIGPMLPGGGLVVGALAPVALLAYAFPEGGTEPFGFTTLWPIVLAAAVLLGTMSARPLALRVGVIVYAVGCVAAYAVPTAIGSNASRLGALVAGPLAALLWFGRRRTLLAALAVPLLFLQVEAPVRDVWNSTDDASVKRSYYQPLLAFLARQPGPPFRTEIPFTRFHWETYEVAPHFPLARGWERQLDVKYDHLFYGGALTPATYRAWLHQLAVRFVAVPDADLDFSAKAEGALIRRGLPYLRIVWRSRHWTVYAVRDPSPIVQGPATLTAIGPDSLTMHVHRPGTLLVRVRFTPYWALGSGSGCVEPAGSFTKLTLKTAGTVKLVTRFSLARIGATSPRCT